MDGDHKWDQCIQGASGYNSVVEETLTPGRAARRRGSILPVTVTFFIMKPFHELLVAL
jgi:hypothetical protein